VRKSEAQALDHGIYRIHWKSGGWSLASVGSTASGERWFAPTNWIAGIPCTDWKDVDHVTHEPPCPKFEDGEPVKYIDQPQRPLQEPDSPDPKWGVISGRSYHPRGYGKTRKEETEYCWFYAFGPGVSLWYEERFLQKLSLLERIAWEAR